MPYQPKRGGYRYRQHIAAGHQATRKVRRIVESVLTESNDLAAIYLKIAAITLLSVRIDDTLQALADFDDQTNQPIRGDP